MVRHDIRLHLQQIIWLHLQYSAALDLTAPPHEAMGLGQLPVPIEGLPG